MMKENYSTYEDVARIGNVKSEKVVEATIGRGLRSLAKLSIVCNTISVSDLPNKNAPFCPILQNKNNPYP